MDNPKLVLADADKADILQEEYRRRFKYNEKYRQRVWHILVENYFQKLVGSEKVVLDLGSGWGEFINHISALEKWAMDLNPESSEKVDPDVRFLCQDCTKTWDVPDGHLDVIFTSNFFEHLPTKDHMSACLEEAFRCLKSGGKIICLGPNLKYTGGKYWDYFDHYLPLTELSVVEILEIIGFKRVSVIGRFLPYTMAGKTNPPLWLVRAYLRLPFLWRFFGKQFLVVCQKP